MKNLIYSYFSFLLVVALGSKISAQSNNAAPYCLGAYANQPCAQSGPSNSPSNFINDFIDDFSTSGANTNITNIASGCNSGTVGTGVVNYVNFCQHYLAAAAGQTIVCTMRSGIIFQQGFAIWVDWNQDNSFNVPTEYMGGTAGVPAAATNTTITFVVPSTQANGTYRMRVRCAYFTVGASISPCGGFGFGETEDYTVFVGPIPPNSSTPTGTAIANAPLCAGQTLSLSLSTTYSTALSYSWTGPGSFTSNLANPVIPVANLTNTGVYSVLVSNSICPIVRTVTVQVVPYPVFTVNPQSYTICQGGSFFANVPGISPATNSFTWGPPGAGIFNPGLSATNIAPPLLAPNVNLSTTVYSVTVSPNAHYCAVTQTLLLTINNPLTPTLTMPSPMCDTAPIQFLTAVPGGGTWSANPGVSPGGAFNPALAFTAITNTLVYTIMAGTCIVSSSDTLRVSKYYSPALTSSISTLCVQDPNYNLTNIVQNTLTSSWYGPAVSHNTVTLNYYFNPSGLATGNYTLTHRTTSKRDSAVCPSNTQLVVYVFNPVSPTINQILPRCSNEGQVFVTASPSGGIWSGSSGITFGGVQTPSSCAVGTNSVMYTAGLGTCVAASTRTFFVNQFNTASLTAGLPNFCVNSTPFNLMSIVQNTNGSWSGPNVNLANYFSPLGLLTNTYSIVYTTTSTPIANLCSDSRTISANVLNPVTPSIIQVGPFCNIGSSIQMSVSPATGYWVTSPFLNSSGVFSPSLSPVGLNAVQYVIGTSTCNSSATKNITIEGFVSAGISGVVPDLCNTSSPINLAPITNNSTGFWTGPGITGTSFNPAMTGAGSYIVQYNTSSQPSGLCPDQATVAVRVYSLSPPSIANAGTLCNNAQPRQIQVSPVGGLFGSGNPGIITPSGIFNPALGVIGTNLISYSISVGPCLAYAQQSITIEKFISSSLTKMPESVYCKNREPFDLNSLVENPGYSWNSNEGGIAAHTSMFNPRTANPGQNIIVYTTHSAPLDICPDQTTFTITVVNVPTVTANSTKYEDCAPMEVFLNCPTTNIGTGTWNFGDGQTDVSGQLSSPHVYTIPGTYTVTFNYTNSEANGCVYNYVLPRAIVVKETPKADFTWDQDEILISNPDVTMHNLSTILANNSYTWTVQDLGTKTGINPVISFPHIGNFRITLVATNFVGCNSEISKVIEVKNDFNIFIPNSFTPNADGLNDKFMPVFSAYGLDPKSFEMQIYDRWGHFVFETKDVSKGWDGSFENKFDSPIKQDSYIYKIHYKDINGRLYEKTGSLTLMPN